MDNKLISLDNLDKKILYELDNNSRQSASKIAKKLRVHKTVVNFRINRLVSNGIIKQFVAMISPSVLGLIPCKLYLQMQNFTKEREKEFIEFIKSFPIYWSAKVSGKWDFILGFLVKDMKEFNEIKNKIIEKYGRDIINKSISVLVEAPHYSRTYLTDSKENKVNYWIKETKIQKIDENDKIILKILAENSRTQIIDIAQKTKLSVKTCISRIKQLEKKDIIYGYKISIDLSKVGYNFFKCFITLKDSKKEKIQRFLDYCKNNKNIIHLVECLGDWDYEPEFEIESYEKFQEQISQIKEKFNDIIKSIETINILKEYSYVCVP